MTDEQTMTPLMTVAEVAEITRLSRKTIYNLAARNEIPVIRLRRRLRFRREAIEAWIAAGETVDARTAARGSTAVPRRPPARPGLPPLPGAGRAPRGIAAGEAEHRWGPPARRRRRGRG